MRPRALLTMGDMGMEGMDDMVMTPEDMVSGWKRAGTPPVPGGGVAARA